MSRGLQAFDTRPCMESRDSTAWLAGGEEVSTSTRLVNTPLLRRRRWNAPARDPFSLEAGCQPRSVASGGSRHQSHGAFRRRSASSGAEPGGWEDPESTDRPGNTCSRLVNDVVSLPLVSHIQIRVTTRKHHVAATIVLPLLCGIVKRANRRDRSEGLSWAGYGQMTPVGRLRARVRLG